MIAVHGALAFERRGHSARRRPNRKACGSATSGRGAFRLDSNKGTLEGFRALTKSQGEPISLSSQVREPWLVVMACGLRRGLGTRRLGRVGGGKGSLFA